MKKYSILGLILVSASAVVAAILPSKKAPAFANCNGLAVDTVAGAGASYTCQQAASGVRNCFSTIEPGAFSVTNDAGVTNAPGANNPTTVESCTPLS